MTRIAIYPGTFDPIHNGHADLIRRAVPMFDKLIVAVAVSAGKRPRFTVGERVRLVETVLPGLPNVEVSRFDGLLIHFAAEQQATVVVRGLRAVSDFEYELQLASTNRKMMPTLETIFLPSDESLSYISSTLVREIAALGGDVSAFVDSKVVAALNELS